MRWRLFVHGLRYEIVKEKINSSKNPIYKVLDVGCGRDFDYNWRKYKFYVVGVDRDKSTLENLYLKSNTDVVLADANRLPFRDKSMDMVTDIGCSTNPLGGRKIVEESNRIAKYYYVNTIDLPSENMSVEEQMKKYTKKIEEIAGKKVEEPVYLDAFRGIMLAFYKI